MQIAPYLSFKGDCEEAFQLYAKCFGGQLGEFHRYGGSPMEHQVPAGWDRKVMHASLTIGGAVVMGADTTPEHYAETKGLSMSVHMKGAAEAERIFAALAEGGKVTMPLEKTFWAERFGVVTDRFGIPWAINCE